MSSAAPEPGLEGGRAGLWGRGAGDCPTRRHGTPTLSSPQPLQCLKVLTMSGWNPPGTVRHGDLMYLFVITAEDRQVSITASTPGFYLNQ